MFNYTLFFTTCFLLCYLLIILEDLSCCLNRNNLLCYLIGLCYARALSVGKLDYFGYELSISIIFCGLLLFGLHSLEILTQRFWLGAGDLKLSLVLYLWHQDLMHVFLLWFIACLLALIYFAFCFCYHIIYSQAKDLRPRLSIPFAPCLCLAEPLSWLVRSFVV